MARGGYIFFLARAGRQNSIRFDVGMLVGRLLQKTQRQWGTQKDLLKIHASLASGQFAVHARAYLAKHGWPAHPTMICERVLAACGDA